MKVLVDTSAWVDFLNGYESPEATTLAELLTGDDDVCTCGVVVAEVFQGLRRQATRAPIEALFREMTLIEPVGIETYLRAAEIHRRLREKGRTVRSTIDCLIATVADESGCYVLARDRDIETILTSGLLKARLWRPHTQPS